MVCILANGLAGNEEITTEGEDYKVFSDALYQVLMSLTKMLAKDGEGAGTNFRFFVAALFEGVALDFLTVEAAVAVFFWAEYASGCLAVVVFFAVAEGVF